MTADKDEMSPETLRAQLALREQEIEALRRELEETNKGVLALYAELDDKAVQLRSALELKSRFLSYMSHEFRTPLTSITSMSNILLARMDGPLSAEQVRQIEFIRGSVRELTEMVDDLLDLAKADAGRLTVAPESFDVEELFSTLRGVFKPLLTNKEVSLVFDETPGLPLLHTDLRKLSQILRNFVSNALKFTVRGEVRVGARRVAPQCVELSVRDTGVGIAGEDLARLWDDFVQLESPLQQPLRGTGLGLSIARRFAELLGGCVGVDSVPGKGSRFWVLIPLRYGESATEAAVP